MYLSITHSIKHSIKRSINQSINWWIDQCGNPRHLLYKICTYVESLHPGKFFSAIIPQCAILFQNGDKIQVMPLSDGVVVVVMGRCNLHSSGAERHINLLIRHNRHAAVQKRMQRKFSLHRENFHRLEIAKKMIGSQKKQLGVQLSSCNAHRQDGRQFRCHPTSSRYVWWPRQFPPWNSRWDMRSWPKHQIRSEKFKKESSNYEKNSR